MLLPLIGTLLPSPGSQFFGARPCPQNGHLMNMFVIAHFAPLPKMGI
jgi:hypothetical protein